MKLLRGLHPDPIQRFLIPDGIETWADMESLTLFKFLEDLVGIRYSERHRKDE